MTKIEEIARGLFNAWRKKMDETGETDGPRSYDEIADQEKKFGLAAARGAVNAMRTTNKAMINAANVGNATPEIMRAYPDPSVWVWHQMIDAILNEDKSSI